MFKRVLKFEIELTRKKDSRLPFEWSSASTRPNQRIDRSTKGSMSFVQGVTLVQPSNGHM